MKRRRNTAAKGRRIQALAKAILKESGALVEPAPNRIKWIKIAGKLRPISLGNDFFGVWDLLAVHDSYSGDARLVSFYQVTTLEDISHRRKKIIESGFPSSTYDAILGYVGGKNRHFRVFWGPRFETWDGTCWKVEKQKPGPAKSSPRPQVSKRMETL